MNISEPSANIYTIYSKSDCKFCLMTKYLLEMKGLEYEEINCHNFLLEDKEEFIQIMKKYIGHEYRFFPMVFYNKQFIGGYTETNNFIQDIPYKITEKALVFNEEF
jgi:glutaredoxin